MVRRRHVHGSYVECNCPDPTAPLDDAGRPVVDFDPHERLYRQSDLPAGRSWATPPDRYFFKRCDRCRRRYFVQLFYEVYGPADDWWWECQRCALITVDRYYEADMDEALWRLAASFDCERCSDTWYDTWYDCPTETAADPNYYDDLTWCRSCTARAVVELLYKCDACIDEPCERHVRL